MKNEAEAILYVPVTELKTWKIPKLEKFHFKSKFQSPFFIRFFPRYFGGSINP